MSQNGPRHVNGFPSLAAFIASDRDYTTLISKRFDRLAARNLLHLQSELARLQRKLDSMDFASTQDIGTESTLRMKQYLRNWDDFILASNDLSAEKERFELVKCIQATLKGYREALLFESTLASLPRPAHRTLKAFLRKFFNKTTANPTGFPTLGGNSQDIYEDQDDLVALKVPEHSDRLTTFVQDHLGPFFETGVRDGQIAYASDIHIARFMNVLSIFLAAMLLIGAIIGLYVVQSPKKRLGMLATFTILFAAGVGLLTNARKPELFAATAA